MTAESHAAPRIAAAPTRIASRAVLGPDLRQMRPVILPLATAGTVLLIWQLVVTAMRIPAVILPPPVEIAVELWRNLPVLPLNARPPSLAISGSRLRASPLGRLQLQQLGVGILRT